MSDLPTPLAERFWSRVSTSETGCWLWTGAKTWQGYGRTEVERVDGRRRYITAHRRSWEINHGPVSDGIHVLHHCDNPPCVRPSHLFLGTHADNVADRHAKGRDATGRRNGKYTRPERTPRGDTHWTHQRPDERTRGERIGGAKLTEDQVREIRRLREQGMTLKAIGDQFGVALTNIDMIVKRRTWKHNE